MGSWRGDPYVKHWQAAAAQSRLYPDAVREAQEVAANAALDHAAEQIKAEVRHTPEAQRALETMLAVLAELRAPT